MKLSTKTVASLLVVTSIAAAVPGISQLSVSKKRRESQFDKLLQRHDRKGEIRAEILGMDPLDFKQMSKKRSFEQIISSRGMSKRAFRMALLGTLRNELKQRGWSAARIDSYVRMRSARMVAVPVRITG